MSDDKKPGDVETKEVTMAEYQRMPSSTPIIGARAVVDVIDKDGIKKASLEFSTDALKEELDNANS